MFGVGAGSSTFRLTANLHPKADALPSDDHQNLPRRLYSSPEGNKMRVSGVESHFLPQGTANMYLTAIVEEEGDGFVALCPELDVASQGESVEEATDNLREAVELLLATADALEIASRLKTRVYVTHFEARVGAA
jgi:predicted RNase H-like HicB family nuclease